MTSFKLREKHFFAQILDLQNIYLKISAQQRIHFFFQKVVLGVKSWVLKDDKQIPWWTDIFQCYWRMGLAKKILL